MRILPGLLAALVLLAAAPTLAATPSVTELPGEIRYTGPDGRNRTITFGRNFVQPVLAPDGRTLAFIERRDDETTALWIGDGMSGKDPRVLIGPHEGKGPTDSFTAFGRPIFSLDGGFIYVSADAWVTSTAVHQVSIRTGRERYVIDGLAIAVIRTGPYRGFLLVSRHKYPANPEDGAYDTVDIVRPDGKEVILIPGSEAGDWELGAWLRSKGWRAW